MTELDVAIRAFIVVRSVFHVALLTVLTVEFLLNHHFFNFRRLINIYSGGSWFYGGRGGVFNFSSFWFCSLTARNHDDFTHLFIILKMSFILFLFDVAF